MIELNNIDVNFVTGKTALHAVKSASLKIGRGEMFGIVGTSGAGKSTLLRTINLLERPTGGSVTINGVDVTAVSGSALRTLRLQTGMIFQQFNLIHTRTVYANIAFPLKVAGKSREEIARRVPELLALVGLEDKADAYPARLSGGQKQRVGIARALANSPQILLCDEPTSALDLETTASILELLREINQRLGITVVVITHEMAVVKAICDRVAVMHSGEIIESGTVYKIFAEPEHEYTRQLVSRTFNLDLPQRLLTGSGPRIVKIHYRGSRAEEPIISETVRQFGVQVNILHGQIEYIGDNPLGVLVAELVGELAQVESAISYICRSTTAVEVMR
jgi:D-methionine transport system ATP-binding protein